MNSDTVSTKQKRIADLARLNPKMTFTSLNHYLDEQWLRRAYDLTRKDGAPGIDGQTAKEYERHLEDNLRALLGRMKAGIYRAPAVKRAYIPKLDGSQRALGLPTFEDKVAQRAVAMILESIYEVDFYPLSFGFRRGRSAHQALRFLRNKIMEEGVRWVVDVDVRKYFDTINHSKLREFLDIRVKDGVIRKLIDKWLKAGVMEKGQLTRSSTGTPQGGVISPILANVFMHYVLDVWFCEVVVPRMQHRCSLVRFCDDFVLVFEDYTDCSRVMRVLGKRFERYGLELHAGKTKLVDFRFKRPISRTHPSCTSTTFSFLGFLHVWGKSRRGKHVVLQLTSPDRYRAALKKISLYCKWYRHEPLPDQQRRLSHALRGHYSYFGITGNSKRVRALYRQSVDTWRKWLIRRTRKGHMKWERFNQLMQRFPLPLPRIYHQYTAPT